MIHTVGPVWRDGRHGEPERLAACYRNCFHIATEQGFRTLAFPAISCGAYAYPVEQAAVIAVRETLRAMQENDRLEKVFFCCFGELIYGAYVAALAEWGVESRMK